MSSALPALAECCNPCLGQTYTVTAAGTSTAVGVFVVDLAATLRMLPSLVTNLIAFLKDLDAVGDGLGGYFSWEPLSAAPADASVIKATDGGGEWHRML